MTNQGLTFLIAFAVKRIRATNGGKSIRHTTDTVKAVRSLSSFSFCDTINGRCNLSKSSSFMLTQTIPVPCFTMKAIASGVTNDAAIIKSPSFSLSSSSTTITIYKSCLKASVMDENPPVGWSRSNSSLDVKNPLVLGIISAVNVPKAITSGSISIAALCSPLSLRKDPCSAPPDTIVDLIILQ
nr:hypothetical protein Iba_chr11aCG2360 [Ipomoea batatas]GMD53507.1 hypothetical protein Iba_chr11cCG3290 [Ipomoea batatas]GMD58342.1 hypothetical protein Iba_chr11fCG4660 [Ipomoea batatas]